MVDEPTRINDRPITMSPRGTPTNAEEMIGFVLKGSYRIEGKIGEGGMGVVFKAIQMTLGRPVAVKMVHLSSSVPATAIHGRRLAFPRQRKRVRGKSSRAASKKRPPLK